MFLGGLPAELIVQICQYLPFAWTDRRIMQIVRRNMALALYPPLNINCFEIHPIKSMNPNKVNDSADTDQIEIWFSEGISS